MTDKKPANDKISPEEAQKILDAAEQKKTKECNEEIGKLLKKYDRELSTQIFIVPKK